jgi:predicted Abi (CAAX) family protease
MDQFLHWLSFSNRRSRRWIWVIFGAIAVSVLSFLQGWAIDPGQLPASQYSSTITAPFNQPSYYPTKQALPSNLYRPVADWVGRLVLPTVEQYQQVAQTTQETDWVWFEVYTAPTASQNLVGQKIRLAWNNTPLTQNYVKIATRDVRFTPQAEKDFQNGVINPIRLNGRNQVGPLQSLAGGHPDDDVTVQLWGKVTLAPGLPANPPPTPENPKPVPPPPNKVVTLRIEREPLQATGRFYILVKFLEPVVPQNPADLPQQCPDPKPCTSDLMRVQHYNPKTRAFDGAIATIRIPQQPADVGGVFNMTTHELATSPAGTAGWYVYGAKDKTGRFTAQALKPRSLFQLPAQQTILGLTKGLQYINYQNWENLEQKQGQLETVLVDAQAPTPAAAAAPWKLGTRALLMHTYGGRGGTHDRHESYIAGTYAGHFSLGIAEVVKDPFTSEPIFDPIYFQVYGNGSDGTLSGGQTWAHYMGNLRRGFMGTRPISDTLIQFAALTEPYTFGDTQLSFFNELMGELSLVGARYRIGDGSGNSTITSATSCVQDSSQALFITLQRFKDRVEANPQIIQWMRQNPNDPNTQRFKQLVKVAQDLAEQLTPMGVVRWDWQQNANILTGVEQNQPFISIDNFQPKNLLTGLISWRTAMPRQAYDEFAMLFLHDGASLWFLRTTIIGGNNPGFAPLEPTLLLGAWKLPGTQIPLASWLVIRTFGGVTIPTLWDWLTTLVILLVSGAIALFIGFTQGILQWHPWQAPWYRQLGMALRLLIVPALVQEYIFRVLLIPYPKDWIPAWHWWAWAVLALGLFVGWQWLYARFVRRSRFPIITHPMCLTLITILGLACTLTYRLTGSLWTITLIHWAFVTAWWMLLGGKQHVSRSKNKYAKFT